MPGRIADRRNVIVLLAAAVLAGAWTDVSAQANLPELQSLQNYLETYQRSFAAVIADEVTTQTVTRDRVNVSSRTTRGEYFVTFVARDGIWMSVHDITEVNGSVVSGRGNLRALLSGSIRDMGPAIARSNARFNIGSIVRNFNEPTLALQLISPARSRDVRFTRDTVVRNASGELVATLDFRLAGGATFIGSIGGRRVTTRGTVTVETSSGRLMHTSLTVDDGDVRAVLETAYASDERLGLWLPARFTEIYSRRNETTTVETTFSNYRRFEGSGRLIQ